MGQKGGAGQRRSASSGGGSAASATSEGDIAAARFGHYSGDDPRRAVTRASRSGPSFSGISTLAGGALSGSLGAEGSEKEAEAAYSRAGTPGAMTGSSPIFVLAMAGVLGMRTTGAAADVGTRRGPARATGSTSDRLTCLVVGVRLNHPQGGPFLSRPLARCGHSHLPEQGPVALPRSHSRGF